MATKRKTTKLRQADIIEVEEYHDGNYGGPGKKRQKKEKASPEQIQKINALNKVRRCRLKLLEYFDNKDIFATWTYSPSQRPPTMKDALKDFQKAIRFVKKEYKKRGYQLRWIRNIERGTKGAWHIHIVVNNIGDTESILAKAWKKGGIYNSIIELNEKLYDEDFTKLANYLTKDENTTEKKKDGTEGKSRIKESSYSCSRNMPLPEPKVEKLVRWKKEITPKKGYKIIRMYEGINPLTGYMYRRYTMMKIKAG